MLYPLKRGVAEQDDQLMDKYEYLLIKSKEIWEESIAGGGYKKKDSADAPPAKPTAIISTKDMNANVYIPNAQATSSGFMASNKPSSSHS